MKISHFVKATKTLPLFIGLSFATNIMAAEADHFTRSDEVLIDESAYINNLSNEFLQIAVDKTNQSSECDDEKLYENLKVYFANHKSGLLVLDLLHTESIDKRVIPLNESIYRKWGIFNGFLLGRKKAASSPLALTPLVRVGDVNVGVDKFEHMFGMGYRYFNKYYGKNKSLKKVLKGGVAKEKTFLGGNILATGVFSYADLAANFNGMRFWNHMLQKHDDILGENLGPYITCHDNKYKVVKNIDFKNYIDLSMDESINCSKYATKKSVRKIKKRLSEFKHSDYSNLCSIDSDEFKELLNKYDVSISSDPKDKTSIKISHYILNDDGLEDVSYFNEF